MKCKNCKFWGDERREPKNYAGYAECQKLNELKFAEPENEAAGVHDTGWETEDIVTGKDFGCIYFKNKLEVKK